MEDPLATLVGRAKQGEQEALESLVKKIQTRIYNLSLRMLWHPEDAKDATQEILIRVITHLGTFRGESKFLTWMYRIASHYLIAARKSRRELFGLTPERLGQLIDQGVTFAKETMHQPKAVEDDLLVEEVRIGCTLGMLLFLDRKHRIVYILGEVMKLTSPEGAPILGITQEAFRKRLSRSREIIRPFMKQHCGLVNQETPCRCEIQVAYQKEQKLLEDENLLFVNRPTQSKTDKSILQKAKEVEELERAATVYRSHPHYKAPSQLVENIKNLLHKKNYSILE